MDRALYAVGKIAKAFGIRGEVIVRPLTDSATRFKKLSKVFVGLVEANAVASEIDRVRVSARGVRVKLAGVNDRTAAETLVGSLIFVDEQHRISLSRERYFVHDVIGLTVLDDDGAELGTVKDVLKLPAHDVYVVENAGREIMVPAVKEFIRSIDMKNKLMRVHLIEGMVEEK